MSATLQLKQSQAIRRNTRALPSLWSHLFWAIASLVIIVSTLALFTFSFGKASDVLQVGSVTLDPAPLPPMADSLDGNGRALPDLLAGIIPDNVNPTVHPPAELDALGNPISKSPNNSSPDTELVGGGSQPSANRPVSSASGPSTVLIDGKPINSQTSYSPLPSAPIAGLTRLTPFGPVPRIAEDGRRPAREYARTPVKGVGAPVSIILGGLGVNRRVTQEAIETLPPSITLSFAAHTPDLQNWIDKARQYGHEVLLELPMESSNTAPSETGAERTLRASANAAANIRNLDWMLSRAQGYFGIMNYNGDRFLTRADALAPMLSHLTDTGLGFIFDGSVQAPTLGTLTASANIPYAKAFSLIDETADSQAITQALANLETAANHNTSPIGVGFAYPETISALKIWTNTLEGKSIHLAPASSVLR